MLSRRALLGAGLLAPRERRFFVAQSGCNRAGRAGPGFGVTNWIGMLGPAGMDTSRRRNRMQRTKRA
jgi:hypothetical protein